MPARPPSTVVIVTWRGAGHLAACLDAVAAQHAPHRTIVVDNASTDGSAAIAANHQSRPQVLRLPDNRGYAGGIAAALPLIDTEYVAWLNDDAVPAADWLSRLVDALAADAAASAASGSLHRADGTVQSVGVALTADGHGTDATASVPQPFGFCGGAALLRTTALKELGGVPAEFFCYYEDTDTAWRMRLAGWRIVTVPAAHVRHTHGASTRPGSVDFHRWNERNRLLTLLRCSPPEIAARELARFTVLTAVLPLRRRLGRDVGDAANFATAIRLRVLGDVVRLLPRTWRARRAIGAATTAGRRAVWRRWAGRHGATGEPTSSNLRRQRPPSRIRR